MSYLDTVLNVVIDAQTRAISQRGFGLPLLLVRHDYWTDPAVLFGSVSELIDAGVDDDHPMVAMAQALKSQAPVSPPLFMVGRRATAAAQTVQLVLEDAEEGKVYQVDVDGERVTYTAAALDTEDDVADALVSGINAISTGPTATNVGSGDSVQCVAASGVLHHYTALRGLQHLDATAATGVQASWDAVIAQNDSFYAVFMDSQSKAEIAALAPRVESARKLFLASSADHEVLDPGESGDIASVLQTAGYARTSLTWHSKPMQYFAGALLGRQLPKAPGSTNWAWQAALSAVDYMRLGQDLTSGNLVALDAKNCNHYTDFTGQTFGTTLYGKSASGEYIDVTRFSDWMRARMQERLLALFVNSEKVPQTADGLDKIESELRGQFADGVTAGGLDPNFATVIDMPTIDDIPVNDRANRRATGIRARHRLAGAFNSADLTITLTL